MMAFEHVGILAHLGCELVDISLVADRDSDECRNVFANFFAIKKRLIAPDDAAGLELLNSFHNGRRRQFDLSSYICQPRAPVILENIKYF